jgi:hypothetical protein
MLLAGRTPDYLVEITSATLAAQGSFFVAEHYHCSGVLAALTASLVVGNFRSSGSISAAGRDALGTFLGIRRVRGEFADLLADWRPRSTAAFYRSMGAGAGGHCSGDSRPRGRHLSSVYRVRSKPPSSGSSAPTRPFLGRTAGCFGTRVGLVLTGGFAAARCHRSHHLCRRRLLRVRSRPDHSAVAATARTDQVRQAHSVFALTVAICLIFANAPAVARDNREIDAGTDKALHEFSALGPAFGRLDSAGRVKVFHSTRIRQRFGRIIVSCGINVLFHRS